SVNRRYVHLRIFVSRINSVPANKYYAPILSLTRALIHARAWRECFRQEHGVDHRRGRAISLSMGTLQDLSARSLVGKLCSGRTIAHGAIAQPARPRCVDHLARLQTGLPRSRPARAPGFE